MRDSLNKLASIGLDSESLKGPILITNSYLWDKMRRKMDRQNGNTHGVSSMTRHTHAMVLRQSVVSSMGKVLF